MSKELKELSLLDIAPPSIKTDETVINIIKAIDSELLSVSDDISEAFIISRIKTLPEPVLDLLAWQWHVDFYELANNIDAKRDMVLNSIQWHNFNPRSRKGSDQSSYFPCSFNRYFNPRSRKGSDYSFL